MDSWSADCPGDVRKEDYALLARRYLDGQAAAIEREAARVLTHGDPDGIHRMRVAIRRSRAVLRTLRTRTKAVDRELRWLARQLGVVRDIDVQRESPLLDKPALAGFAKHLRRERDAAMHRLERKLNGDRYEHLLRDYRSAAHTLPHSGTSIADAALEHVGAELQRVKRRGRAIDASSADRKLHVLRRRVKRLRYVVGAFEPVYGPALRSFDDGTRRLQTLLGEFHDACVGIEFLTRHAERLPAKKSTRATFLDLGRTLRDQELRAEALRQRFPEEWKRFDRQCTRNQLRVLLGAQPPRRAGKVSGGAERADSQG